MTASTHQKILNYIDLIKRSQNKNIKFFHFDDGRKCIIDGNYLKLLPTEYNPLYNMDCFYVHIDPEPNIKKVMYYAYDVENYGDDKRINEKEGFMNWESVEDTIYNFFALNIRYLSTVATPYVEVDNKIEKPKTEKKVEYSRPQNDYSGYMAGYNSGYGTAAYKERDAFYEKLWTHLKDNKTSAAMDHIEEQFSKMSKEKKFDDLDTLLRLITFDKLNIPSMLGILDATKDFDSELKERYYFFNKVKAHLIKVKPKRADDILKNLKVNEKQRAAL